MPHAPSRRRRRRRSRAVREPRRPGGLLRSALKWLAAGALACGLVAAAGVGYLWLRIAPELPDVQALREVQLQMPLRIYTADGDLIAEYGEKRREPVQISEVPRSLVDAIVAAEDKRFYEHPGVDWQGLARAAIYLVRTGRRGPGGSTITMQVARNFFLSNERTYSRKLTEIFLALKIERALAKDEILELYLNKIYLGNRAYGFAAAARVYYGKPIAELTLAEAAMLAGLPKAPSRYNPIVNPERALIRRDYVLGRMRALDMIDETAYRETLATADTAEPHVARPEAEAAYVGEMVRARVQQLFGNRWATAGYSVFTSIRSNAQRAANASLRDGLLDYERRHGYRGAVATLDAATLADPAALRARLDEIPDPGGLTPAVVVSVDADSATLVTAAGAAARRGKASGEGAAAGADASRDAIGGAEITLGLEDVAWARERLDADRRGEEITAVDQVLGIGDVIMLQHRADGSTRFVQEPGVEAAFVAMEPSSGAITALVGGFDYYRSKFNRVTQARRQPGSAFKPFIYSAALAAGDTAATVYNDAPVVFHDEALEGEWRPSNYSGRFYGPTRLREALVQSRNLVSVRVLREIGVPYARDYVTRFGFDKRDLPPDLSLALGSATVTPMQLASAFAIFANGGYRVPPHFIERIEDPRGRVVYASPKVVPCEDCDGATPSPLQPEMDAEVEAPLEDAPTDDTLVVAPGAAVAVDAAGDPEPSGSPVAAPDPTSMPPDTVDAPRVLDARNAYIMDSMMREVIQRGTARRAGEALGRSDLAGKTGTTNNYLDAWFAGFNSEVVATAWIGSDGLDLLGHGEAGGVAALPIWTAFMADTLAGTPETLPAEPEGIETVRIDRKTGEPASGEGTMLEIFMDDNPPGGSDAPRAGGDGQGGRGETAGDGVANAAPARRASREQAKEVEQLF